MGRFNVEYSDVKESSVMISNAYGFEYDDDIEEIAKRCLESAKHGLTNSCDKSDVVIEQNDLLRLQLSN